VNTAWRWAIVATVLVLPVIGWLTQGPDLTVSATSYGKAGNGYGALYALLDELHVPVARTTAWPGRLPERATVWWIEPRFLWRPQGRGAREPSPAESWPGRSWVERGGTAVLFLPDSKVAPSIAGLPVPPREGDRDVAVDREDDGAAVKERKKRGIDDGWSLPRNRGESCLDTRARVVSGVMVRRPRYIESYNLRGFRHAAGWRVRATLDGAPFVIEHALGHGRVVLIPSAGMFENTFLDRVDAGPLAIDLVRAFGAPLFDERDHGLGIEENPVRYLARSRALPVFAGLAVLGLLFVWRGTALSFGADDSSEEGTPSLDAFVDSLARLYARTGDHARVLECYRGLTVARLRRLFGLGPDTPLEALVERLRRQGRVSREDLETLMDRSTCRSEAALREAARRLDAIVEEAR
jgi:hypothetical protein